LAIPVITPGPSALAVAVVDRDAACPRPHDTAVITEMLSEKMMSADFRDVMSRS
jgi:hypothetical protein